MLIADSVDEASMQIFLDEFSKKLTKEIILVMDNASWHKSLNIPKNIENSVSATILARISTQLKDYGCT